jgi:methenyltetrahydrofolate cyclohydrolase
MKLTEQRVVDLLAAFRSSDPTPGGGSASALAGAVGASLLAMVAALPKPRASADADVARLQASGARCGQLAERLTALVDRDSEAYDLVMGAYRLPKTTDEEKTARSARIQDALRAAIDAPLDVMRASREALAQAIAIAALGNRNAASDVQVGVELLGAALRGARLNVEINLGSVKDAGYVAGVRGELDELSSASDRDGAAARARLAEP